MDFDFLIAKSHVTQLFLYLIKFCRCLEYLNGASIKCKSE